jgi:kinetochore protein Spc24
VIANLDTQKFRVAKTANDLEIESERLSSQLADLQARLQELELQGVDGSDDARRSQVDDENSLRLRIYKGLGMDAEKDANGEYSKIIMWNANSGKADVVNLDKKLSRFFYANYFWERL